MGHDLEPLLRELRRNPPSNGGVEGFWSGLGPDQWPSLFELLTVAADLPRLGESPTLKTLSPDLWPQLSSVTEDLARVQTLVDQPILPPGTEVVPSRSLRTALDDATTELQDTHCVTVEDLLDAQQRAALDARIDALKTTRMDFWGQLDRDEEPALFELFDAVLGGHAFRKLTGFDLERDEYSLTLALQDLQSEGIGWHRDLYWPKEWVGQDVFPILYGLTDDSPHKGGAFVYYVPWHNALYATYRQRHQATVMWNSRDTPGRLLHAVTGYHGADTSRHLLILQCLRRG